MKLALWILVLILLVGTVSALGVTPGRINLNFEPNAEHTASLKIVNSEKKAMNILITAEGELSKYIELNENKIRLDENEQEKIISYNIKLPDRFDKPGLKEGKIVISEVPENLNGELVIGAYVSVVSQVRVQVPYPDKYAEAEFDANLNGNEARLHLLIKGLGEKKIESVKGTIVVEKDGLETARKEENLGSLEKFDRKEMLDIERLDKGDYFVTAIVDYDGKLVKFEREFSIGSLLEALGISVNPGFSLGGIAELNILLANEHNFDIKNAATRLILQDSEGNVVADVKGITFDLTAKKQDVAKLYLNTEDLRIGTYSGRLILTYGNRLVEKPVKIVLAQNRIDVSFDEITGLAVTSQKPGKTDFGVWIPIMFGLIIVILILVIFTNIRLMRYMRRKGGPG